MNITEEIRSWGMMLLFVSAGSLIYCFLLPSGNVSKTAKSVVSITVLSLVFFPLLGVFSSFSDVDTDFSAPPETEGFDEYIKNGTENAVREVIADVIRKYTNVPYKTEIFIDKTDDGSINIEYIGITFSAKPEKEEQLREALFLTLGIMPDIKVEYISE